MPKKILIFSLSYYPKHIGGAEVAIKEITDRILPEEYEFHIVCNRYDKSLAKIEEIGNTTIHRIGLVKRSVETKDLFSPFFYLVKIFYIPLASLAAVRLNRVHKFDGFWCMMLYMAYPVVILRLFGIKKPYVLTLQEGDTYEHVFERWYIKLFQPLLLSGIRNAKIIQVISNFLGNWSKQKGYQAEPVLIPNAVNTKLFSKQYSESDIQSVRDDLGKKSGDLFLVTTSRLVNKNATDDVIRAIAQLPQHIHFIVYGTGPDESMLQSLINELGVEDRVHLMGHLDHAEMPKHLKACDVFIRPSRSEGMGNSFVEAMAAGLPVIATQEGGIADFLFDENLNPDKEPTGWAVQANNPKQIVSAVQDIISHPEKVKRITINAKKMVLEEYDWDLVADKMKNQVFKPLLESD